MSDNLRECPFCGEERIFLNPPSSTYPKGSINCPACLACMPGDVDERELIASWNQRAAADHIASPEVDLAEARRQRDDIGRAWDSADARAKAAEAERDALRAAVAEAREALAPFVNYADDEWTDFFGDDTPILDEEGEFIAKLGDFRRAARALSTSKQKDGGE
jgi:Lar family restriction alleviation protein